jgi:hypothetical protein
MGERAIIWSRRAETELRDALEFYIDRNQSNKYSLTLLTEVEKAANLTSKISISRKNFRQRTNAGNNQRQVSDFLRSLL